ncbi:hypothetical protein JCGZ_24173 [Jatropha curcas]|uniref:Aminotransferase-like plant mobile domain-containing protein n=1 Tax=Jatropha curcas TaxID=180498 RepID=A0A067JP84_JATCU|nr:hypothetical protein JCGZ_24173 [Jatropha curcas]
MPMLRWMLTLSLRDRHLCPGLVPSAWRWYRTNLHTIWRKKSLRDLRAFFDTCTLEQVVIGPLTARLQSWIQADPDFQRSDALSRRRATGTLHPDLANLRLPYSIPYYLPNSPPAFREVSLESVDRPTLPSEDITEVPIGLVNQMVELVLGMQQELTTAWTQLAFDDQRRRRPRR